MDVKLNANKILVEPVTEEKIGNIILPVSRKKSQDKGRVIVAGPIDDKSNVKVGDTVHYNTRNGTSVEIEDKEYVLLDVSAIIFYM